MKETACGRKSAALADTYIKIPMEGRVESLNAAMASGILMYEAARQRRGGETMQREKGQKAEAIRKERI